MGAMRPGDKPLPEQCIRCKDREGAHGSAYCYDCLAMIRRRQAALSGHRLRSFPSLKFFLEMGLRRFDSFFFDYRYQLMEPDR